MEYFPAGLDLDWKNGKIWGFLGSFCSWEIGKINQIPGFDGGAAGARKMREKEKFHCQRRENGEFFGGKIPQILDFLSKNPSNPTFFGGENPSNP